MHKYIWVGLDVHKVTIAVAVAKGEEVPDSLGTIPNDPDAIAKLRRKLGPSARLRVGYEAGPCGYVLYRQLTAMGIDCAVVAPRLVPVRAADRVKTDRRDALSRPRLLASGEPPAVAVPDEAPEALRELVRAREAAHKDLRRARHRLQKFLLRQGHRCPLRTKAWGVRYLAWVSGLRFAHAAQSVVHREYLAEVERLAARRTRLDRELEVALAQAPAAIQTVVRALQVLRGVVFVTAVTAVAEVGQVRRFTRARQLMAYSGLVPRESSSGDTVWRGDHEDGQRPPAARPDRSGLAVPPPAARRDHHPPAAQGTSGRALCDRREGRPPLAPAVSASARARQEQGQGGDGDRARTARLPVGGGGPRRERVDDAGRSVSPGEHAQP